jgi:hypothetical protein
MKENGAGKDVKAFSPGPPNEPTTFCMPCAAKKVPSTSRNGTGAHEAEVDVSLRNITATFRIQIWLKPANYKSV